MLLRRLAAPSLSRTALRRAAGAPSRAYKAFTETEMPAIIDLFHAYAVPMGPVGRWPTDPVLDYNGLKAVLESIGERPDDATVRNLFIEADTDASGTIELSEFLAAADRILGDAPARSILMIGGPGSGKGVLSARLVAQCGVSHVSCGDMLREEVRRDTPLGRDCDAFMRRGELIPSSAIITLLKRRMREYPGRRLLLDGFPRSRQNAQDFAATCGTPELAISLICPEELMIERILRRATIEGRADDNFETATNRIKTFQREGAPTLAWLRDAKVPVVELDASGTPADVWEQLLAVGRLMRSAVAL